MQVTFTLDGRPVTVHAAVDDVLLDVIRGLGRTGTKEGCGVGVCGACTVLLDGLPVSACLYLAPVAEGTDVWTVEGLAERDPSVVEAFVAHEGLQCGICTPGQVAAAAALRRECPAAGEGQIRQYLGGNLCRCTGYATIVESVQAYLAE